MKTIGVISDTHDVFRDDVKDILRTCDGIIHAGDITTESLLEELRRMGNIYVVRGNNDWRFRRTLSQTLRFEIEGVNFFMTHDRRNVFKSPARGASDAAGQGNLEGVDVVIFGHSHKYFQEMVDGRLWLNPGSCGRPRFGGELSMAVMTLLQGHYQVEKIPLKTSTG